MAVKIRLKRMGKKRQPSYRVVVADGRSPRDGRFIEQIGRYDPLSEPSLVEIDNDRAIDWLSKGAQPTDAARKLLEISGAWGRYKASKGEVHTLGEVAPPAAKEKMSKKAKAASAAAAEEVGEAEASSAEAAEEVGEAEAASPASADADADADTAEAAEEVDDAVEAAAPVVEGSSAEGVEEAVAEAVEEVIEESPAVEAVEDAAAEEGKES